MVNHFVEQKERAAVSHEYIGRKMPCAVPAGTGDAINKEARIRCPTCEYDTVAVFMVIGRMIFHCDAFAAGRANFDSVLIENRLLRVRWDDHRLELFIRRVMDHATILLRPS